MTLVAQKLHGGFSEQRLRFHAPLKTHVNVISRQTSGKADGREGYPEPRGRERQEKKHDEEIKRIQMGGSDSSFHTLGRSKVRRSTLRTQARYTDRQAVKHSKVTWTHGKSMNINQKLRANVTYLLHLLMKNHSPVSRFR